ncbi:hypothetical protein TVAG_224860 [Trichomonas vaginalis G3]|uniref:Polycystin cation channel PKD1/PKD2 domain-containing protein n=1 Tax=Trichomonas vaginalis (strain ATCC PRA-98 / G3) TaxID=412133 RepID=A2FSJ5_TRIV3|nr:hypothetical protein TVAGG3_0970460 [Trichomonas vaginalis G3]EAX92124.1 hypothetical protein TVAG_224860 [Trichomonas vaginalis G3]KAI5488554.1 hypothetical protein TVAGG3_0970460 [Trichomonas vaginalis G3]|eukprot:XP_001305054.1 hypothetical protein [Trichomonas vaginalis G3]
MFVNIFYAKNHEAPVSNTDTLNEYFQSLFDNAQEMHDDFLLNVSFPDPDHLLKQVYEYSNGTTQNYYELKELDPNILKNVSTIRTLIPTYIISSKKRVPGCSAWTIDISVSMVKTDPAFWLSSKVHRTQCPQSIHVEWKRLEYVMGTTATLYPLIFICISHFIYNIFEMHSRIQLHQNFYKNDHRYHQLKSSRQLHYTVGMWIPVEFLTLFGTVVTSCFVIKDIYTVTELPSLLVMELFSVTSCIHLSITTQLFAYTKTVYLFVLIIRDGFILFFNVIVGTVPFLFAIMLSGVFMFATYAKKTRSFWSMYEIINSFEYSNNILPMYNEFSDGTTLFNWLSFAFMTVTVIVSGWIVLYSLMSAALVTHSAIVRKQKMD